MFGMGLSEIAVIVVIAIFVFGPDRLPDLARQVARMLHTLRGFAKRAQTELRSELGPEYADLRLRDLDPRETVRRHVLEALEEIEAEEAAERHHEEHGDGAAATWEEQMDPGTGSEWDQEYVSAADTLLPGELPPYDAEAT